MLKLLFTILVFLLVACSSSVTDSEPLFNEIDKTAVLVDNFSVLSATCDSFTVYNPSELTWSLYGVVHDNSSYGVIRFFLNGRTISDYSCSSEYVSFAGEVTCEYSFPEGEHSFWFEGDYSAKTSMRCDG